MYRRQYNPVSESPNSEKNDNQSFMIVLRLMSRPKNQRNAKVGEFLPMGKNNVGIGNCGKCENSNEEMGETTTLPSSDHSKKTGMLSECARLNAKKCRGQPRHHDYFASLPSLRLRSYLISTSAPASFSLATRSSASALATPSLIGLGAPSTRSFASFRPKTGKIFNDLNNSQLVWHHRSSG